jgi:hypothetical protein
MNPAPHLFYTIHCLFYIHYLLLLFFSLQNGEAESYRNVEVEFIPGRTAKMTIYNDGVAGEAIDMTLLITKEDMHKLMIDKGFEKLTEAEIELQKMEQSQLFPTGTNNKQKELAVQRRETQNTMLKSQAKERHRLRRVAKEARIRQKEDREILGLGGVPSYMKMFQVYVGAATVAVLVAVYAGVRRQRRRKPTALRLGLSSSS